MFSLSRGGRKSAPSGPRSPFSYRRPALEALEARWLPAAPAPAAVPAATTVANDTALVAAVVVQAAPAMPAGAAVAVPGQPAAVPPLIDPGPLGFPGRVVFPGTGLQVRSATAPGPMDQPPGAFVVGGTGAAQPADPNAPATQTAFADAGDEPDRAAFLDFLFSTPP